MPLLKAYTYIADVVLDGGGAATVTHNVYTNSGIAAAQQRVVLTPTNANGVGVRLATANIGNNSFGLAGGGAAGTVRVHVQAVHSIQQ